MSSTNKTANYELSQFLGTDKPAWLTDYNSDMSKIDAGINTAQTTATGADGKADTANTAIGTLANLTTTVKTDVVSAINEVDGNADSAQSVANDAYSMASGAKTTADGLVTYLTINTTGDSTMTNSSNINAYVSRTIRYAVNSDGSLGKLYGSAYFSKATGASGDAWIKFTSGFRPASQITVSGLAIVTGASGLLASEAVTIDTDGTVTLTISNIQNYGSGNNTVIFPACLIFVKDFGD